MISKLWPRLLVRNPLNLPPPNTRKILIMLFSRLILLLFIWLLVSSEQVPISYTPENQKERIAIIGAGAGGTSAAYYLQKFTNHSYDITIFEKNDRIGGRATTVDIYGNSSRPFEIGASIFVSANKILRRATNEFNLTLNKFRASLNDDSQLKKVGLYDGSSIFLEIDDSWKTYVKLIWRYGRSPIQVEQLTKRFISEFLNNFYDKHFPFINLDTIMKISGFYAVTTITAELYFKEEGVAETYYKEIIQSFTRVNYAQNLDQIHAIGALVSLAAENAMQIEGGNWQIFANLAKHSNATLQLNTEVTSALKLPDGKWSLEYDGKSEVYDKVIIASPFAAANLTFASHYDIPEVDYVDLHVTVFTSTEKLSPRYFGKNDGSVPGTILTTLYLSSSPPLKFFSISIHEYLEDTQEYVFKIFSPNKFTDEDIAELLSESAKVTWKHRKEWRSYPYIRPLSKFTEFELDDGLWYLNSMETFISTMETSALAGANVAALIAHGKNTTALRIP